MRTEQAVSSSNYSWRTTLIVIRIAGTASIYRDRPVDSHDIDIQDFRGQENDFSIEKNGFELQKLDFAFDGWADDDRVKAEYYPAAADFLKKR